MELSRGSASDGSRRQGVDEQTSEIVIGRDFAPRTNAENIMSRGNDEQSNKHFHDLKKGALHRMEAQ